MESKILDWVNEIVLVANRKYPNLHMPVPHVVFNIKGRCAGRAYQRAHKIEFNLELAKNNPEKFKNTVSHEIAHLVTWKLYPNAKQSHGPEFRSVHTSLGGNGKTFHEYDVSACRRKFTKHVYGCACRTWNVKPGMHKAFGLDGFLNCKMCKTSLEYTGRTIKV